MNTRLRLLYILDYLRNETDENHMCRLEDISEMLESYEIPAARKALYDDIRALEDYGYDIGRTKKDYYLSSREFEVPELKLLIDCVQYSKFITAKKTRELIAKIQTLASKYEASDLQKQVIFHESSKSKNETVYYNIDTITTAIMSDKQISFKYFEYTVSGKSYRHNGELYFVSPFNMIVDDENYYLLAFDAKANQLRHYRIDKMEKITVVEKSRLGKEEYDKEDMGHYSSRVFGMFKGEQKDVRLRFSNNLAGAAKDILGYDIMLVPDGNDHFITHAAVQISSHFFGWIFALGDGVEILGPEDVRKKFTDQIEGARNNYR